MTREVDELHNRIEEVDNTNNNQNELIRRLESEVNRFKRESEVANTNHELEANSLRKRNGEIMAETQEQIDTLNKSKAKSVLSNSNHSSSSSARFFHSIHQMSLQCF